MVTCNSISVIIADNPHSAFTIYSDGAAFQRGGSTIGINPHSFQTVYGNGSIGSRQGGTSITGNPYSIPPGVGHGNGCTVSD